MEFWQAKQESKKKWENLRDFALDTKQDIKMGNFILPNEKDFESIIYDLLSKMKKRCGFCDYTDSKNANQAFPGSCFDVCPASKPCKKMMEKYGRLCEKYIGDDGKIYIDKILVYDCCLSDLITASRMALKEIQKIKED